VRARVLGYSETYACLGEGRSFPESGSLRHNGGRDRESPQRRFPFSGEQAVENRGIRPNREPDRTC